MKKIICLIIAFAFCFSLAGCTEAERVNHNISVEADNFNVCREIVVINVRDDTVLYTLTGYFSLHNNSANELVVTSEIGDGKYKKDYIYLSEWTTYVCTDLNGSEVSQYHYELNILPQTIPVFEVTSNE